MKYSIVAIVLVVSLLSCDNKSKVTYDLVVSNTNLVDGTGFPLREGVTVGVKDGKITAIDTVLEVGNAKHIDGTGKYLIPGLFDGHVHTTDYDRDFPKFIHYGVTSVFIPGGSTCTDEYYAAMRERGDQDSIPAPRVFHTSQHFTMEGRHPAKTYASSNWRDGEIIFYLKDTIQIEQLVQRVAKNPIAGIKLTIEDGPAPPFVERIPQAFIDKTVKEAAKYGLEVFAHASDNTEFLMAIRGGAKNIIHFVGVDIDWNDLEHLSAIDTMLVREGSFVTTLMIDKSFLYPLHPEWFDSKDMLPEYREVVRELTPDRVKRASMYVEILKKEYGLTEESLASFMVPQAEDINVLTEKGMNMVLGTDTGNDFNFPGYSLHEEMQLLSMGGVKPIEIIKKMGTLNAAKMLDVDDELGSIETGKVANMILLDKNPLESIQNTLAINMVIKNGVVQERIN